MPSEPIRSRWGLIALALVLMLVAGGFAGQQFSQSASPIPMRDFVEYWSAAVVNLQGGNPYDGKQLLEWQQVATADPELKLATMMWNPPWALVLVTPLGWLSASLAHIVFLLVQLACLVTASTWLWRVYHGPKDRLWVAWLIAIGSGPSLFLFLYGQIGGLLILGLAGFLFFNQKQQYAVAGVFAALTAIKPHLLFAFGLVMVLDALRTRRGRIACVSGAGLVLGLSVIAHLINPGVYQQYSGAGWTGSSDVHFSPKDWYQPLLSYWFRQLIDPDRFWLQLVPTVLTSIGIGYYWFLRREAWDWSREMPMLVFASVLMTAYGAWIFDLVVLLVPALAVAARLAEGSRGKGVVYAAIFMILSCLVIFTPQIKELITGSAVTGLHLFIWFSPVAFLVYVMANRSLWQPAWRVEWTGMPAKILGR